MSKKDYRTIKACVGYESKQAAKKTIKKMHSLPKPFQNKMSLKVKKNVRWFESDTKKVGCKTQQTSQVLALKVDFSPRNHTFYLYFNSLDDKMFFKKCNSLLLAYRRLQVGVQQHVSIGVDGKVVAIWSKLQQENGITSV